jgi:hypothetical protein
MLGKLVIRTPRAGNKPSRQAILEVRAKEIEFCGRKGKKLEPVFMHAVYATEKHPPKGEAGIEWMLLTTLPVERYEVAEAIIEWYSARWEIEIFSVFSSRDVRSKNYDWKRTSGYSIISMYICDSM